ncbi:MAG: hypothetical protein KUG65_12185 [Sphingomonadaceae bacterium]|nr:hypothetical protein [Sphingomonadaceae bacterium]
MLAIALLSAIGTAPALVARADELNARYVNCLFAMARDAKARSVEESEFPVLLAESCVPERALLREAAIAVQRQRGSTRNAAQAEWSRVEAQGRASVERAYRIAR